MDRLTTRNPDGTIGVGHPLRYYNHEDIVQVLNRLAAYEDTGLEPGEVEAIIALAAKMNVIDLVRENLRLANRLRYAEAALKGGKQNEAD